MPRRTAESTLSQRAMRPSHTMPRPLDSERYSQTGRARPTRNITPAVRDCPKKVKRRYNAKSYRTVVESCFDAGIVLRGIRDNRGLLLEYEVWVRGLRIGLIGTDTPQTWDVDDEDDDTPTPRTWYAVTEACRRLPPTFSSGVDAAKALLHEKDTQ